MRPGAPSLIGKSIKIALDAIAGGGGVTRGRERAGGVGAEGRAGEGGLEGQEQRGEREREGWWKRMAELGSSGWGSEGGGAAEGAKE